MCIFVVEQKRKTMTMNNKITKSQIAALTDGEKLTSIAKDRAYVQRLRNYCQELKSEQHRYSVTVSNGLVTVSRIHTITPQGLTEKLRSMKPGEVCHPAEGRRIREVSATAHMLGGGFKVRTVVEVVKL